MDSSGSCPAHCGAPFRDLRCVPAPRSSARLSPGPRCPALHDMHNLNGPTALQTASADVVPGYPLAAAWLDGYLLRGRARSTPDLPRTTELRREPLCIYGRHREFARGEYGEPLIATEITSRNQVGRCPEVAGLPRPGAAMGPGPGARWEVRPRSPPDKSWCRRKSRCERDPSGAPRERKDRVAAASEYIRQ